MKSLWRTRVERDLGMADGDWSAVNFDEIDWRHWSDEEKRDLFAEMAGGVLSVEIKNGVETRVVTAHPDHHPIADDALLRWLAIEMRSGELEAEVMAIENKPWPPTPAEEWQQTLDQLKPALKKLKQNSHSPTKGHSALGDKAHADLALNALERLATYEDFIGAIDSGESRGLVHEAIATAAHLGFAAGQHSYASMMKPFEKNAVTGQAQTRYLAENRNNANRKAKEVVKARRAKVEQLMLRSNRTGEALTQWLQEELRKAGFEHYSRSTVKADQAAIRKKLSKPR